MTAKIYDSTVWHNYDMSIYNPHLIETEWHK